MKKSENNKINVILLDLDDTLVVEYRSAEQTFLETGEIVREKYGIEPYEFYQTVKRNAKFLWYRLPSRKHAKRIGLSSWEALWAEYDDSDKKIKRLIRHLEYYRQQVWKNVLNEFAIIDDDLALILSDYFKTSRRKKHFLYEDTINVIDGLKKSYRLGLITNGLSALQNEKIDGAGIRNYFEHVIIAGDLASKKPGRKIFKHALKLFDVNSDNCIMVGNSLESDIAGANRMNITSVWINREKKKNETKIKPDFEIDDLTEIFEPLRKVKQTV